MYLALYRKYRPKTFTEIIGQEHITRILTNQILTDKIGHAYLFCGSRGTGKTTAAKILARAVNCEKPINGSPCNKCATCKSLSDISNLDILEIDAASNNGVDEIRDLKEKIEYLPVNGKYKVYIIDEVHMLSQSAFNALLKTLEEPPEFVIFILATTEVHKLPATILSRCMRFDFKLVLEQKIASLVSKIYKDYDKEFEPEAVSAIARAGEGSVRDALSIADICLSYSKDKLTYNDVLEVLGSSDRGQIFKITEYILKSEPTYVFEAVDKLMSSGKSVGILNRDIINCLRDICVIRLSKDAFDILNYPKNVFIELEKLSKLCSYEKVLKCIELLSYVESELRYTVTPRILFETYLLKCCKPEINEDIENLEMRIAELENKLKNVSAFNPETLILNSKNSYTAKNEDIENKSKEKEPIKKDENMSTDIFTETVVSNDILPGKIWGNVIKTLRQNRNGMLYSICSEMQCKVDGKDLIIFSDTKQTVEILKKENNLNIIKDIIKTFGEYNIVVKHHDSKNDVDLAGLKNLIGDKLKID